MKPVIGVIEYYTQYGVLHEKSWIARRGDGAEAFDEDYDAVKSLIEIEGEAK